MDNLTTAIHELLQFQVLIKIYHWQTKTYSRHVAADNLYDSISKHIDLIVETLQGEQKKRSKFSPSCVLPIENMTDKNIVQLLLKCRDWLDTTFIRMFSHSKFLVNIKDEIVTDLNKTLYLFTLE
jgi:hypothetical protein